MNGASRVEGRESSVGAWIEGRSPEAPDALRAHMRALVAGRRELDGLPIAEALLAAGETALARVLAAEGGAGRETALDLLAADAFVTYAFEAAADEPGTVSARAEAAMLLISQSLNRPSQTTRSTQNRPS